MISCNKNCRDCKKLNIRVDDKGYPYRYECMKYGDSVLESEFESTKTFYDFDEDIND